MLLLATSILGACSSDVTTTHNQTIRVATFNVSMDASNYAQKGQPLDPEALKARLELGNHPQITNIAEIIQRVRPDVILLNEFDYIENPNDGVRAFIENYLLRPIQGQKPIHYPYFYVAPVNTGEPSPLDIDGDGVASGTGGDAWGYGNYPGQYGMVVLSRFPIHTQGVRSFKHFLWHKMPNAQKIQNSDGTSFYDEATWQRLRLSSKSHWDLPIDVDGKRFHLLAAHPTPPVFDGDEDRNGARNYDEIRLWADYLSEARGEYLVDDNGKQGGLAADSRFVIVGDYNASPDEGDSRAGAIEQLLTHPLVNAKPIPTSRGGKLHTPDNPNGAKHTAGWRIQADYVLPSKFGIDLIANGVFWPAADSKLHRLVRGRGASSDHRLVWADLKLN